jgi:hypothetical protein
MGRSTGAGNSEHISDGDVKEAFADLSKFHKAQVQKSAAFSFATSDDGSALMLVSLGLLYCW